MNVEIFSFCETAEVPVNSGGKLSLGGIFDRIFTRRTPHRQASFHLAVRIRFDPIESGEHHYRIDLIDADGRLLEPSRIGKFPRNCWSETPSLVSNVIVVYRNVLFPNEGDYEARMAVDGLLAACAPLQLRTSPEILYR